MLDTARPDLTLGLVGVGAMGKGIAQIMAAAGIEVRLLDTRPGAAQAARDDLLKVFDLLTSKGRMTAEAAKDAAARLKPAGNLQDLAGCHMVIEAIIEDLAVKRQLFTALEEVVGEQCLLASNTSSLSVTSIAAACKHPGRVGGFHFFNPVPLMKIVEVVAGVLTEPWVSEALTELAKRAGHQPVRTADTPGFLVNHAGRGFVTEGLRLLQEGITSFDEVDRIMKEVVGFRMGPFELMDMTGLDVSHPVMESIYGQFYEEPRFRPSYLARQHYDARLFGRKVGRGFYAYPEGKLQPVDPPAVPALQSRPVWVHSENPEWRVTLEEIVAEAGLPLDRAEKPGVQSLALVTPLGRDATATAIALGIDATRTVAVDMLFGPSRRRVFMTTPVTAPDFADTAHALLATGGALVSRLHDSPGFVVQRMVATIVNIASDIAQQRIAVPEDIDRAVTLGLGYPKGPLALGDAAGGKNILTILDGMLELTGDPRYRASLWLRRRASLGVSLLTPEA